MINVVIIKSIIEFGVTMPPTRIIMIHIWPSFIPKTFPLVCVQASNVQVGHRSASGAELGRVMTDEEQTLAMEACVVGYRTLL